MFIEVAIFLAEGIAEVTEVVKVIERLLGGVRVVDRLISLLVLR